MASAGEYQFDPVQLLHTHVNNCVVLSYAAYKTTEHTIQDRRKSPSDDELLRIHSKKALQAVNEFETSLSSSHRFLVTCPRDRNLYLDDQVTPVEFEPHLIALGSKGVSKKEPTRPTVYIACPGTSLEANDLKDVWIDLDYKKEAVQSPNMPATTFDKLKFHRGFWNCCDKLPIPFFAELVDQGFNLVFTGHSKGAAVAAMCAIRMALQLELAAAQKNQAAVDYEKIQFIGFGCPPFCDLDTGKFLGQRTWFKERFHFLVNRLSSGMCDEQAGGNVDIVPQLLSAASCLGVEKNPAAGVLDKKLLRVINELMHKDALVTEDQLAKLIGRTQQLTMDLQMSELRNFFFANMWEMDNQGRFQRYRDDQQACSLWTLLMKNTSATAWKAHGIKQYCQSFGCPSRGALDSIAPGSPRRSPAVHNDGATGCRENGVQHIAGEVTKEHVSKLEQLVNCFPPLSKNPEDNGWVCLNKSGGERAAADMKVPQPGNRLAYRAGWSRLVYDSEQKVIELELYPSSATTGCDANMLVTTIQAGRFNNSASLLVPTIAGNGVGATVIFRWRAHTEEVEDTVTMTLYSCYGSSQTVFRLEAMSKTKRSLDLLELYKETLVRSMFVHEKNPLNVQKGLTDPQTIEKQKRLDNLLEKWGFESLMENIELSSTLDMDNPTNRRNVDVILLESIQGFTKEASAMVPSDIIEPLKILEKSRKMQSTLIPSIVSAARSLRKLFLGTDYKNMTGAQLGSKALLPTKQAEMSMPMLLYAAARVSVCGTNFFTEIKKKAWWVVACFASIGILPLFYYCILPRMRTRSEAASSYWEENKTHYSQEYTSLLLRLVDSIGLQEVHRPKTSSNDVAEVDPMLELEKQIVRHVNLLIEGKDYPAKRLPLSERRQRIKTCINAQKQRTDSCSSKAAKENLVNMLVCVANNYYMRSQISTRVRVGFFGAMNAGKTTLVQSLMGLDLGATNTRNTEDVMCVPITEAVELIDFPHVGGLEEIQACLEVNYTMVDIIVFVETAESKLRHKAVTEFLEAARNALLDRRGARDGPQKNAANMPLLICMNQLDKFLEPCLGTANPNTDIQAAYEELGIIVGKELARLGLPTTVWMPTVFGNEYNSTKDVVSKFQARSSKPKHQQPRLPQNIDGVRDWIRSAVKSLLPDTAFREFDSELKKAKQRHEAAQLRQLQAEYEEMEARMAARRAELQRLQAL